MNQKILKLAIPYILVNLSFPLVGLVDTWIVGHLNSGVSEVSLAALALASTFFTSLYWIFSFLKMGTTGFSAKAFGAKDHKLQLFILLRGLLLAVGIGLVIWLVQPWLKNVIRIWFNTDKDVFSEVFAYFDVRIWAAPVTLAVYVFQGWFLGVQNVKIAAVGLFVLNVSNMLFSLYFGRYLDQGVAGVALGTLFSQVFTLLYFLIFFFALNKRLFKWWEAREFFNVADFIELMRVNRHLFVRTLSLMIVLTAFTTLGANYGVNALAAISILFPLWLMASYGIDGFATAAEVLCGEAAGRGDFNNLKRVVNYSLSWGFFLSLLLSVVLFFSQSWIISAFTDDLAVIESCQTWVMWIVICPIVNFVAFIWDGVFLGVLDTLSLQNTMVISSFLVFFPCYFLLNDFLGVHALWLALSSFMLARGLGLTLLYYKKRKVWIHAL